MPIPRTPVARPGAALLCSLALAGCHRWVSLEVTPLPPRAPPGLGTVRIARCDGERIRLEQAGIRGDSLVGLFVGGGATKERSLAAASICELSRQQPKPLATAGLVAGIAGLLAVLYAIMESMAESVAATGGGG